MKVIFVGRDEFGDACLKELITLKLEIALVITTKEEKLVTETAKKSKLKTIFSIDINSLKKEISLIKPDLMIVGGWNRLISKEIFSIPVKGTVAIHASLLPKFRGFAPMTWPIILGEKFSGTTLFYMAEEMDSGDIIGQIKYAIGPQDTGLDLYTKSIEAGKDLIRKYVPLIGLGKAPRKKQDEKQATYAFARTPEDGLIDWSKSARQISNLIRALAGPFQGAFTYYQNKKLFIWEAEVLNRKVNFVAFPGQIIKIIAGVGVWVATGKGILVIKTVQIGNKKNQNALDLFKSVRIKLGFDVIKELQDIKSLLKRKNHASL